MANFNRARPAWRLTTSGAILFGLLLGSLGLSQLPPNFVRSLRAAWRKSAAAHPTNANRRVQRGRQRMEKAPLRLNCRCRGGGTTKDRRTYR